MTTKRPSVLFVCVHNAGKSQMAAAYMRRFAGNRVEVLSAGSDPVDEVRPEVIAVMKEHGINIEDEVPDLLTDDDVQNADIIITMGCADTCVVYPGKHYEDWNFDGVQAEVKDDATTDGLEQRRAVRDAIMGRVQALAVELLDLDETPVV